jgi:hypothetical protein
MAFPTAWLIPAATAVWAVATWAHEHALQREKERTRITALYVNPFLSACEDLQSRIYKLLELDGLHLLQERYPDGSYADETLYLIVRFFGWLAAVNRHGPYTQDPMVIKYATGVRRAFATSKPGYPVGPFNFFPAEQKALGKMVMHDMEGEYGRELDTISFYEFREVINSPHRMPESLAVKQTLENLRNAKRLEDIAGQMRLVAAQHHLVDLLEYLEKKEGYSLYQEARKKCQCDMIADESPTSSKASAGSRIRHRSETVTA